MYVRITLICPLLHTHKLTDETVQATAQAAVLDVKPSYSSPTSCQACRRPNMSQSLQQQQLLTNKSSSASKESRLAQVSREQK